MASLTCVIYSEMDLRKLIKWRKNAHFPIRMHFASSIDRVLIFVQTPNRVQRHFTVSHRYRLHVDSRLLLNLMRKLK